MSRLSLAISVFALVGCQSLGGPKANSKWVVLDDARRVSCAPWPVQAKDLRIDEVRYASGRQPGFLAAGLKRDGSPVHYWATFRNDEEVETKDLVPLSLRRGAVVAGGGGSGATPYYALFDNQSARAVFELRGVKDNVVRHKSDVRGGSVQEAAMVASARTGAWVTYRTGDGDVQALYLDDKKPQAVPLAGTFAEFPIVLPSDAKPEAVAFTRDGSSIVARTLRADGRVSPGQSLTPKIDQDLESWAVGAHRGTHYLAVVDGDSLVGQSTLKVSQIAVGDGAASITWTRSAPLRDVHLTEPVLVSVGGAMEVLVLQWLDDESTIARYRIQNGALGKPTYAGIFPKGSRIVAAFTGKDPDDLYVVVRNKGEETWHFQVCEL